MILYINCQICELKFGLNSLMALQKFSKTYSDEEYRRQLYYLTAKTTLSFDVVDSEVDLKQCLFQAFEEAFSPGLVQKIESFQQMINQVKFIDSDVEFLFARGVGEAGLPPHDFFEMTPKEIDLAYDGYLKRQELQANAYFLALKAWQNRQDKLICFNEKDNDRQAVSLSERDHILSELGLM